DGYNGESGDVVLAFSGPPRLDRCAAPEDCGAGRQCLSELCVPATPADCAGALPAEGPGPFVGDTSMLQDRLSPGCVGLSNAPEAIYAFVSPVNGTFVASTAGSAFDTVLYVLGGCVDELVCNDDSGAGTTSSVRFDAVAGQVYYVVVDGYSNRSGAYNLTIQAQ
ncbi:MAG: PPC domain-containing protein, partial [Myxococcales bacterium]|nr:PPC domain-containing protein [Myxococcales bacterium]